MLKHINKVKFLYSGVNGARLLDCLDYRKALDYIQVQVSGLSDAGLKGIYCVRPYFTHTHTQNSSSAHSEMEHNWSLVIHSQPPHL